MAADVDKTSPVNGNNTPKQAGNANSGFRSWLCKGLWTLILVSAVPILALGIKYCQDAQLLKRHVRYTSVIQYLLRKTLGKEYVFCLYVFFF